jgi:hypothetical protein
VSKLIDLALKLYNLGFNVIPVDAEKKPLTSWSTREIIPRDELEKLLRRAKGIAIAGGPVNPWSPVATLVVVDIDNPDLLVEGSSLRSIVETTVSWYTGPRCPKCNNKHLEVLKPGKRFKCNNCSVEFNVDEAKRGIGALITLDRNVAEKYIHGTIRGGDVELLVNNYALIPPSTHPTGVKYEWIKPFDFEAPNLGVRALVESELLSLLEEFGVVKTVEETSPKAPEALEAVEAKEKPPRRQLRELTDSDIIEVKELLKEAYKPGARQYIWLFLSGWATKARLSPISVAKILKMLYEETGDSDPLKTRASAIVYSYKKAGIDLAPYASQFEELLGVKPYGLEREISEEEVRGKSGLQEILEGSLGEERATEVIRRIEEIFGASSPFRDSIAEIIDYEKQLYAVANLRTLVVVRARREGNRLVYKEKVIVGAPTHVVVYYNPASEVTKYQVTWEVDVRPRPLVIGPALLPEIVDRLKAEGLVIASRLANDALSALVHAYQRRGRAEVRTEFDAPGFYILRERVDGEQVERLIAVDYEIEEPDLDELREALTLLDELATKWYSKVVDRFATAVKWWVLAPFSYAIKQYGTFMPALYQQGPSNTGKSTINLIGSMIWGFTCRELEVYEDREVPGESINTPAKLEHWIRMGTFPIPVREPRSVFENPATLEMLKSAIESRMARGKHRGGVYVTTPALANLSFTSNTYIPEDPSLVGKRVFVLRYTYSEVLNPEIPEHKELVEKFEATVKPRLGELKAIGKFIASRIAEKPSVLREATWIGHRWLDVAETLLAETYSRAGLNPPEWIKLRYVVETITEIYEDKRELVREFLVKKINEEYNKFVGRIVVEKPEGYPDVISRQEADLRMRVEVVLDKKLIPWLLRRGNKVIILKGILKDLEDVIRDAGSLKSLAELLGWEYDSKFTMREGEKVRGAVAIIVNLEDFINFLSPSIEGPEDPKGRGLTQ